MLNLSAVIIYSMVAIMLLTMLRNVVMGRSVILRSLEARLPRGFDLALRILASLLIAFGITFFLGVRIGV